MLTAIKKVPDTISIVKFAETQKMQELLIFTGGYILLNSYSDSGGKLMTVIL